MIEKNSIRSARCTGRPTEVLSELKFHDHQGCREKVMKLWMPNININNY